ncbi:MAG: hypothetical protein RR263_02790 [Oscillospiraceae bacterium]
MQLQVPGYDVDNHFIRRIENGERFVTDIELHLPTEALHIPLEELVKQSH